MGSMVEAGGSGGHPWEDEVWGTVLAPTYLSRKEAPPLPKV